MKKIKKYKRWPEDREILKKRLHKIFRNIDYVLYKKFPFEKLMEESGQKEYQTKFVELFSKVGYIYDLNPEISFNYVPRGSCRGAGISIWVLIRDKKGIQSISIAI